MQTSTKAALGAGATTWLASLIGQGNAFVKAARTMNAQIEADCAFLDAHGHLPDVAPSLPLTGGRANSKVRIAVWSWLIGDLIAFIVIALPVLIAGFAANDPSQPPAMTLLGAFGFGLMAALLGGWLPGLFAFAALGTRENIRRSTGAILDEFREYWQQRTEAMHAIPHGRDPRVVRNWLWMHHIPLDDE